MFFIRKVALLLTLGVAPWSALAQSNPDHLVTLNTRTFDLGIDVSTLSRDPDFVPMNDIDWLRPILDADPLLGATVFHLGMVHPSMITAEHLWSFDSNFGSNYRYGHNISEKFVIDGLETRSYGENRSSSVLMIPTDPDADYSVTCDMDPNADRVIFCAVLASYPPDPLIFLKARLYFPEPWDVRRNQFGAIAERMREIAHCLDVTDRELELDAEGIPRVADCRKGAGS